MLKQESNEYLKNKNSPSINLGYSFCIFMIDSFPSSQDTSELLKNMLTY